MQDTEICSIVYICQNMAVCRKLFLEFFSIKTNREGSNLTETSQMDDFLFNHIQNNQNDLNMIKFLNIAILSYT